jgi:hypothetical protein
LSSFAAGGGPAIVAVVLAVAVAFLVVIPEGDLPLSWDLLSSFVVVPPSPYTSPANSHQSPCKKPFTTTRKPTPAQTTPNLSYNPNH